ncbi:MAG: cell surface protein, partial [Burkholderiaceae bacterium]|nr:cell surface protein [Burkholderiaceae bacterium]
AVDGNKNTFVTGGTLTTSDIRNSASYEGKAYGVSVDVGQQAGKYGVSGVGAGIGSAKGEASSVTTAGISGIAGNTAVRSTDAEAGIQKIFDAAKVQREINAQVQITQAFSKEAPKAVANYAGIQLAALNAQLKDETDPTKRAALQADITKWSEGGAYRVALHTLTGALSGGISGAAGAAAVASSADLMTDLQNGIRDSLISAGLGADAAGVVAQGVATLTAAGVGAAVGGAQGAATGSTVDANNRQLHPNERTLIEKLAKDKAKQVCQGNTECETLSAVKWADLMERAAEGQTGSSAYEKNLQYLTSLAQASAQPGSEGAMGGLDRYLNDLQTAQALLSPYTGKPITVNGQVVTANGAPQTYFGATPEQYGDPYANTLLGQLPGSIVAGMDQRDQLRLEQMIVQNGSATPIYPVEELLLGGAVGTRVLTAIGRAAGSLDVFLAGRATASSGGNISARQITEEALPVRLSVVEQAALHQIDSLPSTSAQGKLREYIADSYFARNSFTQLEGKCGSGNCFDGVFVKGNKVYINEVKPLNANGSIQLSGPSGNMATQMSDSWIESAISRLELSGNTEALRTAAVIRDAIRREALVKVVTGVNQNGMTIVKLN